MIGFYAKTTSTLTLKTKQLVDKALMKKKTVEKI